MKKIETYRRFYNYVLAWQAREIDSLVVLGKPGLGKTWAAKRVLANTPHHWFSARQTPLQIYREICDRPDSPVVFDDVSSLLTDNNIVDMLKNLCENEGVKTLRWGSTTAKLEDRPTSFQCMSPVLILLNRMPARNPDVTAVLDRCHHFEFEPTKPQIIGYMREYFPGDAAIIDMLEELSVMPSVRTLQHARDWAKSTHLDLHEELLHECGVPAEVNVLIDIMARHPEREWCARYVEATGKTERTYRRHRKMADQMLACRRREKACPDVRLDPPPPPRTPSVRAANEVPVGSGQTDMRNPLRDRLGLEPPYRWWTDPERN
jgi:hypothetical protein